MKKKIIIAIISLIVLIAIGGTTYYFVNKNSKNIKTDAVKFKEEYESLNDLKNDYNNKTYPTISINENNIMSYKDTDQIVALIKNGTGVFYFGYPECPWCRNAIPVLLEAATANGLDSINYINVKNLRDKKFINENNEIETEEEGDPGYFKILSALDSILNDYTLEDNAGNKVSAGEKRLYVPTVVFVKNGQIVGYHMDTVESQKDPYVLLNEEQKLELFNIYSENIQKIKNDTCDESC